MKICLAQINSTIAHFQRNADRVLDCIFRAHKDGANLIVFPEMVLFGYWPSDVLDHSVLVEKQNKFLNLIHKKIPQDISVLIGAVSFNNNKRGRSYFNSAIYLEKSKKPQIFSKELLPNYDIFDEVRHFQKGKTSSNILKLKNKKFLITICEDIWAWPPYGNLYESNPIEKIKSKFDCIINLSASPYSISKRKDREFVARKTAQYLKSPIVYVNQTGAQDEILFDGGSFVLDSSGKKVLQMPYFEECLSYVELTPQNKKLNSKKTSSKQNYKSQILIPKLVYSGDLEKTQINTNSISTYEVSKKQKELSDLEILRKALVTGIKDFVYKNNFSKVHLGLSGGIDSALVAALACEALGSRNVTCIALPGPYSTSLSFDLALKLSENLKCEFLNVDINGIYKTTVDELEVSLGLQGFGLVHENLQSRIRGFLLMAFSNQKNSMLLTTGNKAEYAMGYSTLYGDMCGGLAPIGDLLKGQVVDLCHLINKEKEIIPKLIITRPPSAELRENQKDEDSLPPYSKLDKLVENFIEKSKAPKTLEEIDLYRKMMLAEFKRWQSPPILRVTNKAFGRGRRYPIAKNNNFFS